MTKRDLEAREDTAASCWVRVDDHAAVRSGLIGRDRMYQLCREGRVRFLAVSRRRWFVHVDALSDIERSSRQTHSGPPG